MLGATTPARASLGADERRTLGAICEQFFPKDEYPGALDLGVVPFIETTLLKAHPDWIRVYHAGLAAVDQSCRERNGRAFRELPADVQIRFLRDMEEGTLASSAWKELRPADFFGLVRDHTFKGAYSHPRYGGNRDKGAWKMIGYSDWWAE
jgi:gluconate 2-dehydrogenase gamma chain